MEVSGSARSASERQPYADRTEATSEFAAHVNRGKANALAAMGVDIVVGEREGARFRDAYSGRWYWNCHCNGGVFNLGHRHPKVVAALRDALEHLDVGNHHLISGWRARLASQLAASTNGALPYAIFTPSGSEAVDLAVRLARARTQPRGDRRGARRLPRPRGLRRGRRSDPRWLEPFGFGPPGFTHVPFNDAEALRGAVDEGTAAVILEAIPATLGFPPPAPGYLEAVAAAARESAVRSSSSTRCRPAWDEPEPPGTASRRALSPTS